MAAMCTPELTVKTQLCIKQSPSHFVSLQETEHRQQLMHTLQQTMQLLRTQKKEKAASQFCNIMPVNPDLQYRLLSTPRSQTAWSPCHILAVTEIEPNHTQQTSGNSSERKPPLQSRKKKSNSAQGPFFSSFIVLLSWKECQFL